MTTQTLPRAKALAGGTERDARTTLPARLLGAWREWLRRRRTLSELRRLTDRELADIGLTREALADFARDRRGARR